jgi:hypothetical protein
MRKMNVRAIRLNALAQINNAQRYLEIGVYKGKTFNKIDIPCKVAVDPSFRFDTKAYSRENIHFHEVTSDEFFVTRAHAYQAFDLVYIDGFHTFEQTFRDFCASLAYSHRRTIWVLDDTCPSNLAAAAPDKESFNTLRQQLHISSHDWMGDVFKVVCTIHDFFPQMSFATFPDHGQTAIWLSQRRDFSPMWNSLKAISDLEYYDFLELSESVFKRTAYDQLLHMVEQSLFQASALVEPGVGAKNAELSTPGDDLTTLACG